MRLFWNFINILYIHNIYCLKKTTDRAKLPSEKTSLYA